MIFSLLYLLAQFVILVDAQNNFHPDCADPHNKEISCSVHVVSCEEELLLPVNDGDEPPEAHDVRVEPFARATKHKHQLHVDISWQMPPSNNSFRIRAFELEVESGDGGENRCFLFNVSNFGWTEDSASPRFHFSSESLFEFSHVYSIHLRSLPMSKNKKSQVSRNATMPSNPDLEQDDRTNITAWCKKHSDPQASKWTAAFRRIFLHSLARTIQVEFVGAPQQYCFEAYEVRLKDESGMELAHSHIVEAKDMKNETIGGKVMFFGEYNFTGLEVETDYIPSVIPVERSSDRRCLCPTQNENPYDNQIVCSCIAADWKKVRLARIDKLPSSPCPECVKNGTLDNKPPKSDHKTLSVLIVVAVLALILLVLVYYLFVFYRRQRRRGKALRFHFKNVDNNVIGTAEPNQPLIYNSCLSVLIVYSHDCAFHEAAIHAFAEVLRDTFGLQVHIDQWDQEAIEENVNTYINSSIVKADKVIIVNSIGAYMRTKARHQKMEPLERIPQGPLDRLFDLQIDLALQHARVISVRFPYTQSSCTLYALSPLLQYTIPDNLGLLVSSLTECTLRSDPRLSESDPSWFEKSHHRIQPYSITMEMNRFNDSGLGDTFNSERNKAQINGMSIEEVAKETETTSLLSEQQANVHEVIPEEPSGCSTPRHEISDSAYLSGRIDSVIPTACTSDADNRSSGSDRPDDPIISLENSSKKTVLQNVPLSMNGERIENIEAGKKLREISGKDPGGDSGMITSEFHSTILQ
ncbi:unnamed protein product, partial [Mesorhabditis belari]|uniref:SEFIR domain-containing protein n=1 Tax=Mesorhabditis belari TaxID=2138241 RepID=A0AAF3FQM8_9BILA